MNEEIAQLKRELNELKAWKKLLERSSTIPLNLDQSFKERFVKNFVEMTSSSKGVTSENQPVDESGTDTYTVLLPPDAFLQVVVNNTTYHLAAWTS